MSQFTVDLSGQNALVTGAGAGCGRAIAEALAASGATVALSDLNIERAEAGAEAIQRGGGAALGLRADVSNRFQVANMIEQARDALGQLDILVNAAGVFHAEPLLTIDEWHWRRQLEVNLSGAFFATQLVGRVMAAEGGGRIINLTAALAWQAALPAGLGYMASKAGIVGLTQQAARELAPLGIRVNAIAAGHVQEDDMPAVAANQTCLARAGEPAYIAQVALCLCSAAADFIIGQVLVVDGGASLLA